MGNISDNQHDHKHNRPSVQSVKSSRLVHRSGNRSQTLNRRYIHKRSASAPAIAPLNQESSDIAVSVKSSPKISAAERFAKHPVAKRSMDGFTPATPQTRPVPASTSYKHPTVVRAEARLAEQTAKKAQVATPRHTPSQVLKQQAIEKALNEAPSRQQKQHEAKRSSHRAVVKPHTRKAKFGRGLSMAAASLGLILLAGYFSYLYMPNVSMRVAAVQSGVNASYPGYRPTGYSLSGPIAYNSGEVKMKFVANAGPQSFMITQSKSNWDSSAVLENYVEPKAKDNYTTTRDNGLTIYSFNKEAAWVNDGVLHVISGDAPLSSEHIRRIATSM